MNFDIDFYNIVKKIDELGYQHKILISFGPSFVFWMQIWQI